LHGFSDRVIACFKGLAAGDAIGKQTEMLAHADVRKWYPNGISGFEGRAGDIIPRYRGKRYQWRIGETTDDTEQTLAVATALLQAGASRHEVIGRELLRCRKSVHPGVRMWEFQQHGDPAHIAREGDGCGAAMRVAPVGVIHPPVALQDLVQAAYQSAIPTHGGQRAICAAAAVAAAVSAALDGRPAASVLALALDASRQAESFRPSAGASTMTDAIERVYADLAGAPHLAVDDIAQRYFPDNPDFIVPLAIALAIVTQSAEQTTLLAANVGGDSDSVASIGSAIAGALRPDSVNEEWFTVVTSIGDEQGGDVLDVAASLAARWPRREDQ
jgi:ADP-ribosylglycohydrolase